VADDASPAPTAAVAFAALSGKTPLTKQYLFAVGWQALAKSPGLPRKQVFFEKRTPNVQVVHSTSCEQRLQQSSAEDTCAMFEAPVHPEAVLHKTRALHAGQ
jgi:hypothetical protein